MNPHHAVNRRWWEEVTPVHVESTFYDVEGFLGGNITLGHVEREALGDVTGKRLLHLQCHFGMDTLSWARLGAEVVGIDFSPAAIHQALRLARQTGLDNVARFYERDVTSVGPVHGGPFDIVFTTVGTIVWLASLDGWADTIAGNLADDGLFYFLDAYPAAMLFDESVATPTVAYDYFHCATPDPEPPGGQDYADPSYRVRAPSRQFMWGAAEIFATLETRGLTIFEVREYPFGAWRQFPDMEEGPDGYWYRSAGEWSLPLLLGFQGEKTGTLGLRVDPAHRISLGSRARFTAAALAAESGSEARAGRGECAASGVRLLPRRESALVQTEGKVIANSPTAMEGGRSLRFASVADRTRMRRPLSCRRACRRG